MGRTFDKSCLEGLMNRQEICTADFFDAMPGLPSATVRTRIRSLVQSGEMIPVAQGRYTPVRKPRYEVELSDRMKDVNAFLIDQCPGMSFCMLERGGNLFVSVLRREAFQAATILRTRYLQVYERKLVPDESVLSGAILVDCLVSEAPLEEWDGIVVPSIEKQLVDAVVDSSADGSRVEETFQRSFEQYNVNRGHLLRYARRRNAYEKVMSLLSSLDQDRIETVNRIARYFSQKPVDKVWLFGSFSRHEERPDSDIDILISPSPSAKISLFTLGGFYSDLTEMLQREVDIVLERSLKPFARDSVNKDKRLIYERARA